MAECAQADCRHGNDESDLGSAAIHGELLKLGFDVAESTIGTYLPRSPQRPPSPTWRVFIQTHLGQSVGIDFFTIPTMTFTVLYGFVVIDHLRRRLLHLDVTEHPTAQWTAQHIIETFPEHSAPRFLFRNRDGIFGLAVRSRIQGMGIKEVISAPRSPWQYPYAERMIGSIRRELLDHMIILNEQHARKALRAYRAYYNRSPNAPFPRQRCPRQTTGAAWRPWRPYRSHA